MSSSRFCPGGGTISAGEQNPLRHRPGGFDASQTLHDDTLTTPIFIECNNR